MTSQELKQKLEAIKWLDNEIQGLQLEMQYLDEKLFKKSTLTQASVQTSRINHVENKIVNILELKENIQKRLDRVIKERLYTVGLIDKLSDPLERAVSRMCYVNHLEIWEIEDSISKSKTTIYRIKRKGVENLAKILQTQKIRDDPLQ
ncbi:TPA: DUF1492 domain-containing protein [Streptococcus agalactiae]